jgi:hypothetical protein
VPEMLITPLKKKIQSLKLLQAPHLNSQHIFFQIKAFFEAFERLCKFGLECKKSL